MVQKEHDILFTVVTELGVGVKYPPPPLELAFLYGNRAIDGRDCFREFLGFLDW